VNDDAIVTGENKKGLSAELWFTAVHTYRQGKNGVLKELDLVSNLVVAL